MTGTWWPPRQPWSVRRAELRELRRDYARTRLLIAFVVVHVLPFWPATSQRVGAIALAVVVDYAIVKFADWRGAQRHTLPVPSQQWLEACHFAGLVAASQPGVWTGSVRERDVELRLARADSGAPRAETVVSTALNAEVEILPEFEWCPDADWHGITPAPSGAEIDVWAELAVSGLVFRSDGGRLCASLLGIDAELIRPLLLSLVQTADRIEAATR